MPVVWSSAASEWKLASSPAAIDEVLMKAKDANFKIKEIVTDKDSSVQSIYSLRFPEGTVTYCSNHCAKTFHKDLQKIKQEKCQVE